MPGTIYDSRRGRLSGLGSNLALGKQRSRDYPVDVSETPDANLRYHKALDWRKWKKGAPLCQRSPSLDRAVMSRVKRLQGDFALYLDLNLSLEC